MFTVEISISIICDPLSAGKYAQLEFAQVVYNKGNAFDNISNAFTAPVKGLYEFGVTAHCNLRASGGDSVHVRCHLKLASPESISVVNKIEFLSSNQATGHFTSMLKLDGGERLAVFVGHAGLVSGPNDAGDGYPDRLIPTEFWGRLIAPLND